MAELVALIGDRESTVLFKTWLQEHVLNSTVQDFGWRRQVKDFWQTNRSVAEVLVVLLNNSWCNPEHVTLNEHLCSPDIELLALSFYLSTETVHRHKWSEQRVACVTSLRIHLRLILTERHKPQLYIYMCLRVQLCVMPVYVGTACDLVVMVKLFERLVVSEESSSCAGKLPT